MNAEQENRNRLDQEIVILGEILREILAKTPGVQNPDSRDISDNLKIIRKSWKTTFAKDMARCNVQRADLDQVRRIQNGLAHLASRYRDDELTNRDIRAVQDLAIKLRNFQSTIQRTSSEHRSTTSTGGASSSQRSNYQRRARIPQQDTADIPIQTIGIFFASLIITTLIGNQFLELETSGTVGFIAALLVTGIAVKKQGFK